MNIVDRPGCAFQAISHNTKWGTEVIADLGVQVVSGIAVLGCEPYKKNDFEE